MKVKVTEAEVKKSVTDFLNYQQNMGRLIFHRLQSGSILVNHGPITHKLQFCEPGTADFVVMDDCSIDQYMHDENHYEPFYYTRVTYLEIKSSKGKQTPDQVAFAQKVMKQNCRYFIVNDKTIIEELFK